MYFILLDFFYVVCRDSNILDTPSFKMIVISFDNEVGVKVNFHLFVSVAAEKLIINTSATTNM